MEHIWDPARFTIGTLGYISRDSKPSYSQPYVLITLNQRLENPELALSLSYNALYSIAADGGANQYEQIEAEDDSDRYYPPPNCVCGDLDSIRPEVLDRYRQMGTMVVKDGDKYSTDFMKALRQAAEIAESRIERYHQETAENIKATSMDIVVLGGLGGRADQAFSQIHHLYMAAENPKLGDIYLMTEASIMLLLHKGLNRIRLPVGQGFFTDNVGIIPVGAPSVITTKGLEWDVTDWSTAFGTQMSTSNHIKANEVCVETTERVIFTVELAEGWKSLDIRAGNLKKENERPERP